MPLEITAYVTINKDVTLKYGVFKYKEVTCMDLETDIGIEGLSQNCAPCNFNCKTCQGDIENCQECQDYDGYDAFYSSWTTWKLFTIGIDSTPYTKDSNQICKQNCSERWK
jgi:hypothetical protein